MYYVTHLMSQGIKRPRPDDGVVTPSVSVTPGGLSVTESAGKSIGTRRESGNVSRCLLSYVGSHHDNEKYFPEI